MEQNSILTRDQSQASSSVTFMATWVIAPLPTSGVGTRIVTVSSLPISIQGDSSLPAVASVLHGPEGATFALALIETIPSARPPAARETETMNWRRSWSTWLLWASARIRIHLPPRLRGERNHRPAAGVPIVGWTGSFDL